MRPLLQPLPERPAFDVMRLPHAPILGTRQLDWPDEAACERFARDLAGRAALRNAIIELHGTLGAGKTTFARHLLRALGVQGRIKSPSFAVVEPYAVQGLDIAHCDFFRFADPREWEDAGLRDLFAAPGLKLVEWPEKAAALLPVPDLRLFIDIVDDDHRRVRLEACSARGLELLS